MKFGSSYIILIKRLLLVLFLYFLCRVGYYLFNFGWDKYPVFQIINAFFNGLIFDINAILYINLVFILLSVLPFNFIFSSSYQFFLKIFFVVTNSIPLYFNIADFQYSKFSGKRSDSSLFSIKGDITQQFGQMVLDFWYLTLIGAFLTFLLWKFYPLKTPKKYPFKPITLIIIFILFNGLTFIGLRGSMGLKPLMPIAAYSKSAAVSNLILNTPFCIIHTLDKKPLEQVDYFSEVELEQYLPQQFSEKIERKPGENVLIFILESFSPEFIGHLNNGKGYTPFLDSVSSKGISFRNCFSNGHTSQVAVSSILAGIPQLMDESIVTSFYQTNNFFAFPAYMEKYNYNAYFFHGGNNGTMGFDRFAQRMGFSYFGANEYPDKNDHDGSWGIYDGPYLEYCAKMLTEFKKPFISAIFTLSSHQPYTIPKEKKALYNYDNEVFNSIAYADDALKGFFEVASKEEWFNNTLFIFVADHTHPPVKKAFKNTIESFRVPLIMYHPSKVLKADTSSPVQQVDILPSIADFLGVYVSEIPKFGSSVFSNDSGRNAYFYNNQSYFLVGRTHYCKMIQDNFNYYTLNDVPIDSITAKTEDEDKLKAIKQYFNNNMISNSFVK